MHTITQYFLKFVAIMRDSLQETLDSKVLYAMVALSGLVILGAASIGFEPKSPEKGIESILRRLPGAKGNPLVAQEPPLRYELQDFKQTNENKPWDSDYHFTIVVHEKPIEGDGPGNNPIAGKGIFRFMVYVVSATQTEEDDMTEQEREARERFHQFQRDAMHGQTDKINKFVKDVVTNPNAVTAVQMERFIANQLAAQGTLVTKSVKFAPTAEEELRFEVQTQPRAETFRTWPHEMTVGFGAYTWDQEGPIGNEVFFIENFIIGGFGAGIAMLIASVVTSFYIPNMLRKGTIDLLLAKPIPRWLLLVFKYIGGLLFMFLNTVVVVVGIWLVFGLRSGLWGPGFLMTIAVLTFQFAIFYAVSTFTAVTTRSPIVCILACCFAWAVLFVVGWAARGVDGLRDIDLIPKWAVTTVDVTHLMLPRYKDLDVLGDSFTAQSLLGPDSPERKSLDKSYAKLGWLQTVGVTLGYIAVLLGASCWWFASKDY